MLQHRPTDDPQGPPAARPARPPRFALVAVVLALAVAPAPEAGVAPLLEHTAAVVTLTQEAASRQLPVRIEGTVVYTDAEWGLLFVADGTGTAFVDPLGLPETPALGARVEVLGVSEWLRGGAAVAATALRPARAVTRELPAPGPAGSLRWTTIEGVVRSAASEPGRGELRVEHSGARLHVHVPAASPPGLADLVDARVRLRGVLEERPQAGLEPRLWVPAWSELTTLAPATALPAVPLLTLAELRQRARLAARPANRVRLSVRVAGRSSERRFVVEDATGSIEAELVQPELVQQDSRIDLWGFLAVRGDGVVLEDTYWQQFVNAATATRPPEPGLRSLRDVAGVRGLSRAEAARGYPVDLTAVVTYVDATTNHLFLQDGAAAIYVHTNYREQGVEPGMLVRLLGRSAPGNLAPIVVEPRIEFIGRAPLPPAVRVGGSRFLTGQDDCRRVQVTGIVRGAAIQAGRLDLVLEVEGRRVEGRLPRPPLDLDPRALVDRAVRVSGVAGSFLNWRGQLQRVLLMVARGQDVELESPGEGPGASGLPVTPVADVLRAGGERLWGHRVRVSGVVLHQDLARRVFLRDRTGTVSVQLLRSLPTSPGDQLDVLGFPAPARHAPVLEDAEAHILARRPPPAALPVAAGELLGGGHDGDLVSVRGRLQDVVPSDLGAVLFAESDGTLFEAALEAETSGVVRLEPGSVLEISGIATVREALGEGSRARLLVRSSSDIRLLERPAWWTPRRVKWLVSTLVLVLAGAFAWAVTLRAQVRERTRELRERMEHEAQGERQLRARAEEMVAERSGQLAEAQEKLLREQRMAALGKITTTVSHELRNPLATISGSLFLIGEALPDAPASLQRALARAERGVRRSNDIIEDLLDYARTRPLERTRFELDPWLRQGLADITLPAGIELVRDMASCATVDADGARLLRCIINLVMNAAEAIGGAASSASAGPSRIEVSTREAPGRTEIRVKDDGPGVPVEIQEQIFEPFFSTKSFGVGLGLSLVRQIMGQHDGGVELTSRPGETVFTLWLPVSGNPPAARLASREGGEA